MAEFELKISPEEKISRERAVKQAWAMQRIEGAGMAHPIQQYIEKRYIHGHIDKKQFGQAIDHFVKIAILLNE